MMKKVINCYYVHKSNIKELLNKFPQNMELKNYLESVDLLDYEVIKYDSKTNKVSLIASPDWEDAYEPIVGDSLVHDLNDGSDKFIKGRTKNFQIYHNKWMFVADDYDGFDIDEAKERTAAWSSIPNLDKKRIGNQDFWFEVLKENNLPLVPDKQKYTSANTSINKNKLPAIYNKINLDGNKVLDYGCGKYTEHIKEFCDKRDTEWYGYDPYNQSKEVNNITRKEMKNGFDIGICSNVLNVIDNTKSVESIIKKLSSCCDHVYFYIYEGDKSGIGKVTNEDCYQRNEKTSVYLDLIKSLGYNAKKRGQMIQIN